MLWLKYNDMPNQLLKCDITKEFIYPGDFYYEDDEDGLIVKAKSYLTLLERKRRLEYDNGLRTYYNAIARMSNYTSSIASKRIRLRDEVFTRDIADAGNIKQYDEGVVIKGDNEEDAE
jgi:hypothetical protein